MKLSECIHSMHFVWYQGRPRRIKTLVAQLEETAGQLAENEELIAAVAWVKNTEEQTRLLAVARAAAGLCAVERNQYETIYVPEIEPFIEELDTALAAVEDLLDG